MPGGESTGPPGARRRTVPNSAPTGSVRWRLVVAYDGSAFHGFARQPNVETVAGALADALARTCRMSGPPSLTCAGRTDAGVHARAQVVHVDLPSPLPSVQSSGGPRSMSPSDLVRSLNRQLAPAVVVRVAEVAGPEFDARHDAVARRYRYRVWNAPCPDPLLARSAWHVSPPLDLRAMVSASDALVGEHDFRAFCRRASGTRPEDPIIRVVHDAAWREERTLDAEEAAAPEGRGRLLRFDIEAGSFCHQMVRSLVGSLVAVGLGRGTTASVVTSLRDGTRRGLPDPAPPHGLCLVAVTYGPS